MHVVGRVLAKALGKESPSRVCCSKWTRHGRGSLNRHSHHTHTHTQSWNEAQS